VLGLALVGFGLLKLSRAGAAAALVGGTLVAASFAFTGHTATSDQHWLLGAVLIVHLLSVIFWFGALLPLYLACRHEDLQTNGVIIEQFSALAIRLVPLIFVAGLVMAAVLVPSLATLRTPYGLLLLAKVGGFALLMGLATLNKWCLGPRIAAGHKHALGAFRASVLTEWGLIAAVLGTTATMTALFSPASAH
jgi:putative copper export protein